MKDERHNVEIHAKVNSLDELVDALAKGKDAILTELKKIGPITASQNQSHWVCINVGPIVICIDISSLPKVLSQ